MTDFSMLEEGEPVIFDPKETTLEDIKKSITVHSAVRLNLTKEMLIALIFEDKSVAFDIYGDYLIVVQTTVEA